jgi:Ca-activated chloride channel family protein
MKKHWFKLALALAMTVVLLSSACGTSMVTTQPGGATYGPPSYTYSPTTYTPPTYTTTAGSTASSSYPPATTGIPLPTFTVSVPPIQTPTVTMPQITIPQPTVTTPGLTVSQAPGGNIGLAAGGAKDIQNFRENINNNYLPLPTDVTYEGLFYDYYFDTGETEPGDKLFNPSYSFAATKDPISGQTEYYLTVGLNSGMKESDFARKALNLVIVLDISGSMAETYDRYYYDQWGNYHSTDEEGGISQRKIDSAKDSVKAILQQLGPGDRFAIVVFNSSAMLLSPMRPVSSTDMDDVFRDITYVSAGGSTNLDAGMDLATAQFKGLREVDSYEYENRVMILTDAQPNTGDTSSYGLMYNVQNNADARIYTTFIGVGVDFNSGLIEQITKVKGANYYSVHSYWHFRQRIEEEFDFMVTPLVFDMKLYFEADGWQIEKVFGSPEADAATGELMYINTLFPAKSVGGENRGGIVVLKLKKTAFFSAASVSLKVSYEDRNGRSDTSEAEVELDREAPDYYDNTGIRKAILLSRYGALLKNWMMDERNHAHISYPWYPCINDDTGITIPNEGLYSQWERTSLPLSVSPEYRKLFARFAHYFEAEMDAIGDTSLQQELSILWKLANG